MSILRHSLVFMALWLTQCQFTDIRAVFLNNKASKQIKERSVDESQADYLKALEVEPLLPAVHSNLGATYDTLKDPERALKLYKNAEEFSRAELDLAEKNPLISKWEKSALLTTLYASLYNQGQLLARENKVDEALQKYQAALGLNPDSIEVKTNIELLFQQKQGGGKGDSENQDKNKDQSQDGKDGKEGKDPKDNKDDQQGDQDKEDNRPRKKESSPKYKPREFKGELTKENVQKIFGEISQQEKKMRTQFSKQNQTKEAPREKDW
ncbi:MAG: tetratricopeptide repeat protein [Bdellovibrionaceae bacterium]|nr:tetratricopeptide repeat protein [Pseudobdellovibrionaceae bacterium]